MSMICTSCGYRGNTKSYIKGSVITELFLWLMFLLPGIIYSIWRLSTKYAGCPTCAGRAMIPESSPRGQQLIAEMQAKTASPG